MAARLFFLPFPTAFTSNGLAVPGAKLYFYESGGLIATPAYTTEDLTIEHPWPVVANGAGRFESVYLDDTVEHRLIIKDRDGTTLDDIDPYIPGSFTLGDIIFYGDITGTAVVTTRALMAALPSAGYVYLAENGREGWFEWSSANNSANVTADPFQGIYVAPATDTDGSSGAWVRIHDGRALASWWGLVLSGVVDDSPQVNSALGIASVTEVILPVGELGVASPIVVPDGKTLSGMGRSLSIVKKIPIVAPQVTTTFVVTSDIGADNVYFHDFMVDASKSGLGMGANSRCHGLVLRGGNNISVERVDALDITGYGHWSHQATNVTKIDCRTTNCEVHFEDTECDTVLLLDCHAGPGDADIPCEALFHQYGAGSRNFTARDCTGTGNCSTAGFNILANVDDQENFTLDNVKITTTGASVCLLTSKGDGTTHKVLNLKVSNCDFTSAGNNGAQLGATTARLVNSIFTGAPIGMGVEADSIVYATGCSALGASSGGAHAYGAYLDGGGALNWEGGDLTGSHGTPANAHAYNGAVNFSDTTVLDPVPAGGQVLLQEFYHSIAVPAITLTTGGYNYYVFTGHTMPTNITDAAKVHISWSLRNISLTNPYDGIPATSMTWRHLGTNSITLVLACPTAFDIAGQGFNYHFREWA